MGTSPEQPVPSERNRAEEETALQVRASDAERHQMVELLGEHAAAGRISLAELEDRVGRAYGATTRGELAELASDLPASTASTELATPGDVDPHRRRKRVRWFFALMGGSTWRARRRLSGSVNAISIMGGDDIDLREAEIEGSELVINAISIMGGASIYIPDTLEVEVSGPAIMGGNDERGSQRAPRPGAPLIRIRSFAFMGGVEVWRLPAETRGQSLKVARRAAKALESGESGRSAG